MHLVVAWLNGRGLIGINFGVVECVKQNMWIPKDFLVKDVYQGSARG